ncbi:hypothetical protein BKP35_05580 [Anaerobacillus arseniciselenatis]|uniref:Cycloisomaltooligosaccharide glucanotransferase n=1 Tax=Anaerobacillus arseniciselenatis TaxID=85682 RepID=A0A1S2LQX2_9BACI|nr:hypothetical protein BKP35_05580 [Anaerobacillus arseniciselenatis]
MLSTTTTVKRCLLFFTSVLLLSGCFNAQSADKREDESVVIDVETIEVGNWFQGVSTDQVAYSPHEPVTFKLSYNEEVENGYIIVQYKHLTELVHEQVVDLNGDGGVTWEWTPPNDDFTGYMTEIYLVDSEIIIDHMNIAVDVSSEWTKFPRYGYLADFDEMDKQEQIEVMERLNRFHINGIQFYDWQDRHHDPLRLENGELASHWQDIANRTISRQTVETYIELAHERNMKAMNYNLLFGGNENYEADGVNREWGLFKDPNQVAQDYHPLPDSWNSDIFLFDPFNVEWQNYILGKQQEVFDTLAFDGWHVDQLGYRGTVWNWEGEEVDLAKSYKVFMDEAKTSLDVYLALNAVSMYGAQEIAQSNVDFLYVEAWDQRNYQDLKNIIDINSQYSNGRLNTVLAAYMNYDLAGETKGEFNTSGVLFTDAVIFASGGAHIELGENMLGREYFPNKNLSIPDELEAKLIHYYDFSVAYQNLLRDNVAEVEKGVKSDDVTISSYGEIGSVWNFTKQKDNKDILHFINFTDVTSMEWKDGMGEQPAPQLKEDIMVKVTTNQKAQKVWLASPDLYKGSAFEIEFEQVGNEIVFTMPSLEYWNMVVIE